MTKSQTWGTTQAFFEIHKVVYLNGKPKIEGIDKDKGNNTEITYFPVIHAQNVSVNEIMNTEK